MSRRALSALAAAVLLLGLSACSSDDAESDETSESASASAPKVAVPAGVTLTKPGSTLRLGQPASVVYKAGPGRVSVVTVTVTKIAVGSMQKDFANFALGADQMRSTPYYVTATVRNAGPGQLGRAAVPLYGHDSTNTFFPAVTLVGELDPCAGGPLAATFGPKATQRTCLVYLVHKGATLESVELRPYDGFDPVRWTVPESVKPPPTKAPPSKRPASKPPASKSPPTKS
ncbi:MAG TPA: hypothetical protein VEX15_16015 [Nocardioidaceae bacterium]|nr:hypothetical protein [Nocardioidaceae bacterium]